MELSTLSSPAALQITQGALDDSDCLQRYSTIPIAFAVTSRLIVTPLDNGLGGLLLQEKEVDPPYIKDYDALPDEGPAHWHKTFDLSQWALFIASVADTVVGGAVVAWNTPGIDMLEGRTDLAVLWDLRVAPAYRGRNVGRHLFAAVTDWTRDRGCRTLKIETQNINVPACRFYARQGCLLRSIRPNAYPDLPDEVQLLWYKSLR